MSRDKEIEDWKAQFSRLVGGLADTLLQFPGRRFSATRTAEDLLHQISEMKDDELRAWAQLTFAKEVANQALTRRVRVTSDFLHEYGIVSRTDVPPQEGCYLEDYYFEGGGFEQSDDYSMPGEYTPPERKKGFYVLPGWEFPSLRSLVIEVRNAFQELCSSTTG